MASDNMPYFTCLDHTRASTVPRSRVGRTTQVVRHPSGLKEAYISESSFRVIWGRRLYGIQRMTYIPLLGAPLGLKYGLRMTDLCCLSPGFVQDKAATYRKVNPHR